MTDLITSRPDLTPGTDCWDADGNVGEVVSYNTKNDTVVVDWSYSGGDTETMDSGELATADRCACGCVWDSSQIQTVQWKANSIDLSCSRCLTAITVTDQGGRWLP